MKKPLILQIVGYSDSGKTTLMEGLIQRLKKINLSILAIKSARFHSYDYGASDSDKYLQSGVNTSVVIFDKLTNISFNKQMEVDEIIELINNLYNLDVVLIEGFKELKYDKILVWKDEIPDSTELDFSTIRYLYSPFDTSINLSLKINDLVKQRDVYQAKSLEELISRIILDLESSG